jgi:dephospho-CoA kinase
MIIGVAGQYCSGKNTVTDILLDYGFKEIDVDSYGHRALSAKREEIIDQFGDKIDDGKGGIDRRKLGKEVFGNPEKLKKLEDVVHPLMIKWIITEVREKDYDQVINAALLFKMGLHKVCDLVIWVSAPLIIRIMRAGRRDKLNLTQIMKRIMSQKELKPYFPSQNVDIEIVRSFGGEKPVRRRVESILQKRGIKIS